jgi:hypothetical protein
MQRHQKVPVDGKDGVVQLLLQAVRGCSGTANERHEVGHRLAVLVDQRSEFQNGPSVEDYTVGGGQPAEVLHGRALPPADPLVFGFGDASLGRLNSLTATGGFGVLLGAVGAAAPIL